MYTYYGLAAFGPNMRKYLWWKKYLTVIQMVQFVLIFTHAFQLLFVNDCKFPKIFAWFIGSHGVLFWFLFSNFYEKTYTDKTSRKDRKDRKAHQTKSNGSPFTICSDSQEKLLNENYNDKNLKKPNGKTNGLNHKNGSSKIKKVN